ncbi:MAG: FAD-dependent oxidoreductase, partial [Patescibacteria group bacterium]|nr:FAD-dependent oxidoreductase [Patescibacteria group bacterium]
MNTHVLGAGVAGLAAGMASRLPMFEAEHSSGGICSSYYLRPGEAGRLATAPEDGEAYRFEVGGGHWIFGGDPTVVHFLERTVPVGRHVRRSGVWFPESRDYVPYPIQNHLRYLGQEVAAKALEQMARPVASDCRTMEEWLLACFGETLCTRFFLPFHELYTAGLYHHIVPQDGYKSPVNLGTAIQGAFESGPEVGYNVTYRYPTEGLDALARRMAARCDIRYGKRAVHIDVHRKEVVFEDQSGAKYDYLLCTLPLNKTLEMAGLSVDEPSAPYTSTLVLN